VDKILIEGLACQSHIGMTPQERGQAQKILIDIELGLDLKPAGKSDSFHETIDYSAVSALVKELAQGREFKLVEALAEQAADLVLHKFRPLEVEIKIRKFSVPGAESVGVEIKRKRGG
jgi:dihydroneopterin aldolase